MVHMNSMTGFGRGEAATGTVAVVAEIRAVNNRFRDVQLRLPREYNAFEPRVHTVLRDAVNRGRLEVHVRRTCSEGATRIVPDLALAEQYTRAATDVARRLQRDPAEVPLAFILGQPGVLTATDNDADALGEWDLVETAIVSAVADLGAMRAREGEALRADLRRHLDEVLRLRAEILDASEGVAERLRTRLYERITRMIGDRVDPARLAQEAAVLADKADVSEELARLGSHCEQFGEALVSAEPVGRKLDFLLQEMNREVNTIGSKTVEQTVSARVVDLKSAVERMREQAANVE
jgi:uncharacterized protein (TIGR00255 family)